MIDPIPYLDLFNRLYSNPNGVTSNSTNSHFGFKNKGDAELVLKAILAQGNNAVSYNFDIVKLNLSDVAEFIDGFYIEITKKKGL